MTYREEVNRPTCPVCEARDAVQREQGRWLCSACWTVFSGSQSEWDQARDQRAFYAKLTAQEARGANI